MDTEGHQEQREDEEGRLLGLRLRELRIQAQYNGRQFARLLRWDNSRVSRLEHGHVIPTVADIQQWCAAAGAQIQIPSLIAAAHNATAARQERRRLDRARHQYRVSALILLAGVLCAGTAKATPPASAQPATTAATADCRQHDHGPVLSGTGRGDTRSGPGAIFAFEYAYYQQRSGQAARRVVASDAAVPSAEDIQTGIDHLPVGTRFCVQIDPAPVAADPTHQRWAVTLTQQLPGQPAEANIQHITTTRDATGRTVITAITAV